MYQHFSSIPVLAQTFGWLLDSKCVGLIGCLPFFLKKKGCLHTFKVALPGHRVVSFFPIMLSLDSSICLGALVKSQL